MREAYARGSETQAHRTDDARLVYLAEIALGGVVIAQVEGEEAVEGVARAGIEGGIIGAAAALAPAEAGAEAGAGQDGQRRAALDIERVPCAPEIVGAPGRRETRSQRSEPARRRGGEFEPVGVGAAVDAGLVMVADRSGEVEAAGAGAIADIGLGLALDDRRGDVLPQQACIDMAEGDLAARQQLDSVGLLETLGIAAAGDDDLERRIGRRQVKHMSLFRDECEAFVTARAKCPIGPSRKGTRAPELTLPGPLRDDGKRILNRGRESPVAPRQPPHRPLRRGASARLRAGLCRRCPGRLARRPQAVRHRLARRPRLLRDPDRLGNASSLRAWRSNPARLDCRVAALLAMTAGDVHTVGGNISVSAQTTSSQALCSFQASQAETRHIAAASRSWFSTRTSASVRPIASSEPTTIAPELTMLLAATVRAACALGTVVVRKA